MVWTDAVKCKHCKESNIRDLNSIVLRPRRIKKVPVHETVGEVIDDECLECFGNVPVFLAVEISRSKVPKKLGPEQTSLDWTRSSMGVFPL